MKFRKICGNCEHWWCLWEAVHETEWETTVFRMFKPSMEFGICCPAESAQMIRGESLGPQHRDDLQLGIPDTTILVTGAYHGCDAWELEANLARLPSENDHGDNDEQLA